MTRILLYLTAGLTLAAQNVVSPEVAADGRVTFRLAAPKAADVLFYGDWMPVGTSKPMAKGANGVWSITTEPLTPSVYIYHFVVDGVTMADPVNPRMKLRARTSASLLEVPGDGNAVWQARNVPHGTVEINYQKSKVLNGETRWVWIYTPPGYAASGSRKFPVLYLFHGSNDTAGGWVLAGHANFILDNLIAEKKAEPMIVVMPFGHAVPFGSPRELQAKNVDVYEQYLLEDVMPMVRAKYRIAGTRAKTAIAGLSMGGGQSLGIGMKHLDLFSAIGSFSAAVPQGLENNIEALKKANPLLWVACGKEDSLFQRSADLAAKLKAAGVNHTWQATPGAHTYTVWRQYLAEFAPLLFH
ncbi:MAG: esterase [Bryobacterales bacterium]|nr:esterase [Bryobacterales bacterium]